MQHVEQIDDVARIVVHGCGERVAAAAVEAAQLRRNHAPAGVRERELPVPHTRVERKGVQEQERAARAVIGPRARLEITQSSDVGHALL